MKKKIGVLTLVLIAGGFMLLAQVGATDPAETTEETASANATEAAQPTAEPAEDLQLELQPVGGVPDCPVVESSCQPPCGKNRCGPPNLDALECTDTGLNKCRPIGGGGLINCGPDGSVMISTAPCLNCPCEPGELCPTQCGNMVMLDCGCLGGPVGS